MIPSSRERLPGAAVALMIVLIAAAASWLKARSWDLWWHLAAGAQILQQRGVPRVDTFSFTSAGVPWVDHEWLFQILLRIAWSLIGPAALTLLKFTVAAIVAAIGYLQLRRLDAGRGPALALVAFCIAGLRFRLADRPEIASLALAPVVALLVQGLAMTRTARVRRLLLLAGVTVLWCNMHAGALLAPLIAASCLAAQILRGRGASRPAATGAALAVAATMTALLLNPYGHHIYLLPLQISGALSHGNLVNPEWTAPSPPEFPMLFLAGIVCWGFAIASLRAGRGGAASRAGMLALISIMALTSVRHIGLFYALLPVVFDPGPSAGLMPAVVERARRGYGMLWGAVAGAVIVGMFLFSPAGTQRGVGIPEGRYPERAADFVDAIAAGLEDARFYNDVRFGGYLIWRGVPGRRVFIDGRNEVHAALLAEISGALDDGRRWQALLDRHGVEGAIVAYRPEPVRLQTGALSTFSETHFPRSHWALVWWDELTMVFVRRDGRFATIAARRAYEHVRPEAWILGLVEPELPVSDPSWREEIRRKLHEDPDCQLAKTMTSVYGNGVPGD